jgi:DNA helicase-2/ATP-dependent DNA helicase PcrA
LAAKKPAPKQITLNEEQQAVVSARNGHWQCLAGPGSGKSACLVSRFTELIKEGVSPDNILSLSFTRTAANNLRDRVEAQVGKLTTTRTAGAQTFHALGLAFALEERDAFPYELAEFPLCGEPVANRMAADASRRMEVDPRRLRALVSLWKRRRLRPAQIIREAESSLRADDLRLGLAYKEYQKKLTAAGVLDFDDLILEMVSILEQKPKVRLHHKYDWLQIDEAQDCSKIEWTLAQLISGRSVLAVGDLSQGLFSFRGSDSKLFGNMGELFPDTKTLYLGRNYRSTPEIVDFIRPYATSQDLASKFHTTNEHGPLPLVRGFKNSSDEALWVISEIKKCQK